MLETKDEKRYLITCLVLVVVLALVSFWNRPNFQYQGPVNNGQAGQSKNFALDARTYQKYLNSLKLDPKASQQLFQQVISQDDIKKQVEDELQISQKIEPPKLANNIGRISPRGGQAAVVSYLKNSIMATADFANKSGGLNQQLFSGDLASSEALQTQQKQYLESLSGIDVPKEVLDLHKALLTAYVAYGDLVSKSAGFSRDQSKSPWPDTYKNYVIINSSLKAYNQNFNQLVNKYHLALSQPLVVHHFAENVPAGGFSLVPKAQALFGLGDFTVTVGDVPAEIAKIVTDGLSSSFSQFMGQFIDKVVNQIESNYQISNFLYYTDALISGEYVDDYLNKYVSDSLDKEVIKKFIPQLSCNQNNPNLKPLFQAKANQYLGFDPNTLSSADPDYYVKLARVGDFLADPSGWQNYYEDLAAQAESEAQKAADRELTSPGVKSPRDTIKNAISLSVNGIVSAEQANLSAALNLGISDAKELVGKLVGELTQNLVTKFVFRGVAPAGASVGVFKEQATCMAAAQVNLVVPVTQTAYQAPPPPPSSSDLLNQACSKLPKGCSTTSGGNQ